MIHNIYTVYDKATKAFLQPFFSQTDGSAIRAVKAVVNTPDHTFNHNPEDYTLFKLGTFDDAGAVYETHSPMKLRELLELTRGDQNEIGDETPVLASPESGHSKKQLRPNSRTQNNV